MYLKLKYLPIIFDLLTAVEPVYDEPYSLTSRSPIYDELHPQPSKSKRDMHMEDCPAYGIVSNRRAF